MLARPAAALARGQLVCGANEHGDFVWLYAIAHTTGDKRPTVSECLSGVGRGLDHRRRAVEHGDRSAPVFDVAVDVGQLRPEQPVSRQAELMRRQLILRVAERPLTSTASAFQENGCWKTLWAEVAGEEEAVLPAATQGREELELATPTPAPHRRRHAQTAARADVEVLGETAEESSLVTGRCCPRSCEEAWSQNIGREKVLTTCCSYGEVTRVRQGELIRGLLDSARTGPDVMEIAKAVARELEGREDVVAP